MAPHVPPPDRDNMRRYSLLLEMSQQIKNFAAQHPLIDFDLLSSTLEKISYGELDSEAQLRAFGKVFEHTREFRQAMNGLDETTRSQIKLFIDGKPINEVQAGKPFYIPASPLVKHHFSLLSWIHRLGESVSQKDHITKRGLPVIYENIARTEIMEVSLVYGTTWICAFSHLNSRSTLIPRSKIGA